MAYKLHERFTQDSLVEGVTQSDGNIFVTDCSITDHSDLNTVLTSVDTVRQLYYGIPKSSVIEKLNLLVEGRETLTEDVLNVETHIKKMGMASRYRFKLQNNRVGFVVLFSSYYCKEDQEGQHLKIELSPKAISVRTPEVLQQLLDNIAHGLLEEGFIPKGCAVHLAADVQGWKPGADFVPKFITSSRTVRAFDGLSELDLSDLSLAVASYGTKNQAKNYMIGKANALQVAVYNKSLEIKSSDKVDYFTNEWNAFSLGTYEKEKTVTRVELRFHHKIIREIGQHLGCEMESFLQASEYLTEIWRYGLERNRLMQDEKYIDPFWQSLMQDCVFYNPDSGIEIKRKKKHDVSAIGRNFTAILGNLISVMARNPEFTEKEVYHQLKRLTF
ncbi:MAG: hypothetical protein GQ532_06060, partial [Methylomarinum sp.]|nr:hypothetical protein [Methylomarinum sp.]